MYRKILLSGAVAAVIVGAGGTALAVTGSDTTSGTPSSSPSSSSSHAKSGDKSGSKSGSKSGDKKKHRSLLQRAEHAQVTTKGKDGKTVTHDLIRGTVTAVSSSSITVQSADKTSETFAVTKDTKVRTRKDGKAATESISSVAKGAKAFVAGTGTSTRTAQVIGYRTN